MARFSDAMIDHYVCGKYAPIVVNLAKDLRDARAEIAETKRIANAGVEEICNTANEKVPHQIADEVNAEIAAGTPVRPLQEFRDGMRKRQDDLVFRDGMLAAAEIAEQETDQSYLKPTSNGNARWTNGMQPKWMNGPEIAFAIRAAADREGAR